MQMSDGTGLAVDRRTERRGRLDEVDLDKLDLTKFNNGRNPYSSPFLDGAFRPGKAYFRKMIADWGFSGLGRIADICSGYARWSIFLAEVNEFVCGFESLPGAVEISRGLSAFLGLDNTAFEVADVTGLTSAPNDSFDGAWCNNALQFVQRDKTLSEIHRILKPGGVMFLGVYNGPARVLEKFFEGYKVGGIAHAKTKFALRGLREGPMFHGEGNYASVDAIEDMLRGFGFALSTNYKVKVDMKPRAVPTTLFAEELNDLQSLAARLEGDAAFAAEFAAHPEVAYRFPMNLHLCAVKV
jgi:SAM-dependent methyltransferase